MKFSYVAGCPLPVVLSKARLARDEFHTCQVQAGGRNSRLGAPGDQKSGNESHR